MLAGLNYNIDPLQQLGPYILHPLIQSTPNTATLRTPRYRHSRDLQKKRRYWKTVVKGVILIYNQEKQFRDFETSGGIGGGGGSTLGRYWGGGQRRGGIGGGGGQRRGGIGGGGQRRGGIWGGGEGRLYHEFVSVLDCVLGVLFSAIPVEAI